MNNNVGSSTVIARYDQMPFGEEISAGTGLRTIAQGYSVTQDVRHRYAWTEKDDATGLDHTWWRKYERFSGRWTSPDPYRGSMAIANPQSFNLYSYTQNDPVNFVDPSGLDERWYFGYWVLINGENTGIFLAVNCWVTKDPNPGGSGGGGGGPAQLSSNDKKKFDKAQRDLLKRINEMKDKSKCAKLLARAGISLNDLTDAVNSIQAFNGPQSSISNKDAGVIDYASPETIRLQNENPSGWTQFENAPVSSDFANLSRGISIPAITGANGSVFFNPRSGLNQNTIFHEALHVATGLGDERLALALGLTTSGGGMGASEKINEALEKNGCYK